MATAKKKVAPKRERAPVSKTPKATTLELLCVGLAETYRTDKSTPGVLVSYIPAKNQWYASIHRFNQPYGEGKYIIASDTGETAGEAIRKVAAKWMNRVEVLAELHNHTLNPKQDGL